MENCQGDDQALCIHDFKARQALALEAQCHKVIFDNGHFIFVDDSMNFCLLSIVQVRPEGFWKSWDDIDHFYVSVESEDLHLSSSMYHAVIIRRDIDKFRLARFLNAFKRPR